MSIRKSPQRKLREAGCQADADLPQRVIFSSLGNSDPSPYPPPALNTQIRFPAPLPPQPTGGSGGRPGPPSPGPLEWAGQGGPETPPTPREAEQRKGAEPGTRGGVGRVGRNQERTPGRKADPLARNNPVALPSPSDLCWTHLLHVSHGPSSSAPAESAPRPRRRLRAEGDLATAPLPPLSPPRRANGGVRG